MASFAAADDRATYLHTLATELEAQLRRLSELPKPVVAGVHGAVAGAGLALVLHADVVVAGESTKFVMAYSAIGLTPDCGVSYLLPRAIGQQRALELAVGGKVLNAEEARDWGLVTEVVDDDQVRAEPRRSPGLLPADLPKHSGRPSGLSVLRGGFPVPTMPRTRRTRSAGWSPATTQKD